MNASLLSQKVDQSSIPGAVQFRAPIQKLGRRTRPRAAHRIEGSVYWLPMRWCRPVCAATQWTKVGTAAASATALAVTKANFSFESRSLRLAPAAFNLSYMTAQRAVKCMLLTMHLQYG